MNPINFNYYNTSLLLGGFATLFSAIFVIIQNPRKLENIAWFGLNLSSTFWGFGFFVVMTTHLKRVASISNIILHIAAILIALFYFLFILAITNSFKSRKTGFISASIISLVFIGLSFTQLLIADVIPKSSFNFYNDAGPLYIYFTIYFFGLVLYSLWIITAHVLKIRSDSEVRHRLKYVTFFTLAGLIGGSSTFFLSFNLNIPPFTLILFSLYPIISSYAIFKYKIINIKVILPQLFSFSICIFVLVYLILSLRADQLISSLILLLVVLINLIFLIRSINLEIASKEKLELLANKLQTSNLKLKQLDQQKNEFLSIASHQLRNPLTSLMGFGSLILKGHFGEISQPVEETVQRMQKSTQSMATLVGEYLDVSRIEAGNDAYSFLPYDLKELVASIIEEHRPQIESAGLTIGFEYDPKENYSIRADSEKLAQVISNLLDNATKYTPQGSIMVSLTTNHTNKNITLAVTDTGIGIQTKDISTLFKKFKRTQNGTSVNKAGTGLGLYVAKKIIESHNGRIWAESEGEGKSATFFIELPQE
jgi:signal transduction histidine kinase